MKEKKTERKDILLQLLQRHKELGISEQIDFDKFYLYSIIVHSTAIEGSTVTEVEAQLLFDEGITSNKRTMMEQTKQKMVDKWSITTTLADKLADILVFIADKDEITTEAIVQHFGFPATTAKRYLRQLTEFGYLESHGGNRNRTYRKN